MNLRLCQDNIIYNDCSLKLYRLPFPPPNKILHNNRHISCEDRKWRCCVAALQITGLSVTSADSVAFFCFAHRMAHGNSLIWPDIKQCNSYIVFVEELSLL